jgi:4-hydroxy 2-oxovalerate aldolase
LPEKLDQSDVFETIWGSQLDRAIILDCTLRDGSYSVDFKFTASDTAVLTGELAALGIEWIEIGHGLGLGAMEAGKGDMPATDIELIQAAKARVGAAKIGMFFIPSLASRGHLERARDAGLDFIRIGDNAPDVEQTFPYLAYAKMLGLSPSLNMMKSYAITPAQFAEKAKGAREAGADVVYCVDSAGCMLPDDVARYVDAAMNAVDCPLGFHGHNGLMMAIANSVRAYQHGARFIDTTLCGLGRGAGNTPTEILVAVLDQMGIPTNIDFFEVVEVAQNYVRPLMSGNDARAMLELVAARYRFHNSYLPTVEKIAERHHVDLRRLIADAGMHDPVHLDVAHLDAVASTLALAGSTPPEPPRNSLLQFDDTALAAASVNDPAGLTRALVDGLVVMRAKRPGSEVALFLAPVPEGEQPAAEFVLADEHQALGRITFESLESLRTIASAALANVSLFLVDVDQGGLADAVAAVVELAGTLRVIPVRPHDLQTAYVREVIDRVLALRSDGNRSVLLYRHTRLIADAAASLDLGPDGPVRIERVDDADAALAPSGFDLILCGAEPDCEEVARLASFLAPAGTILILDTRSHPHNLNALGSRVIRLNLDLALCGVFDRHRQTTRTSVSTSTKD